MLSAFSGESAIVVTIAAAYILFTGWLTMRLRSKTARSL